MLEINFSPEGCTGLGGDTWLPPDLGGWRPYGTCHKRDAKTETECYTKGAYCLGPQYKGGSCTSYCMNLGATTEAACTGTKEGMRRAPLHIMKPLGFDQRWYWYPGTGNTVGACVIDTPGLRQCDTNRTILFVLFY